MRWTPLLSAALLLGGSVVVAAPAAASCVAGSGPADEPVVFVGSALEERRGYTHFEVEGVLAGPDLAPEVWVRSGQDQPPWWSLDGGGVSSSVDVSFPVGETYVVGASRDFVTYACVVAPVGDADDGREVAAPGTAALREPVSSGLDGADPPAGPLEQAAVTGGVVAVLLAALAAAAGLVRRRRSR